MKKVIVLLLIFSLISVFVFGCASNTQPKPVEKPKTEQPAQKQKPAQNEQPKTKVYGVGQTVQLGDYYLTVKKVDLNPKYDTDIWEPKKGKQFVLVDVLIENHGSKAHDYNVFDFTLQDKEGYTYEETMDCSIDPELSSGTLHPGRKVRGNIVFEVPKGDSGLELIYQPDWLDSGQIIVKLTD